MIYSRGEIVELVRKEPIGLQSILIGIIWFCSHCDPNCVTDGRRFGLCQVDIAQAAIRGYSTHPNRLLDVPLNIRMASELLQEHGLLDYLGRDFAGQFHAIATMARYLEHAPQEIGKE